MRRTAPWKGPAEVIWRNLRLAQLVGHTGRLVRGLRFRLTVSYVLFFSVLLVVLGVLFQQTLRTQLDDDVRQALDEEWGAAKAYLRIENERPIWVADSSDPEEAYTVE